MDESDVHMLESTIERLLEENQRLHALEHRKRKALQGADAARLTECCLAESAQIQRIGAVERERQAVMMRLTQSLEPTANRPMRLADLAPRMDQTRAQRLLELQRQLHELLHTMRQENRVVRAATEGLLHHVQGMAQVMARIVAHAGPYGRRGMLHRTQRVMGGWSVTA